MLLARLRKPQGSVPAGPHPFPQMLLRHFLFAEGLATPSPLGCGSRQFLGESVCTGLQSGHEASIPQPVEWRAILSPGTEAPGSPEAFPLFAPDSSSHWFPAKVTPWQRNARSNCFSVGRQLFFSHRMAFQFSTCITLFFQHW